MCPTVRAEPPHSKAPAALQKMDLLKLHILPMLAFFQKFEITKFCLRRARRASGNEGPTGISKVELYTFSSYKPLKEPGDHAFLETA